MRLFTNMSLRQKLTALLLIVSATAILLSAIAVLLVETNTFEPGVRQEIKSISKVLNDITRPAIDFRDNKLAQEYLTLLKLYPNISAGAILLPDGEVFAIAFDLKTSLERAQWPIPPYEEKIQFLDAFAEAWTPIKGENEVIGWIYLKYDLPALWLRLPQYTIMFTAIIFSILISGIILTYSSHRLITSPLLDMSKINKSSCCQEGFQTKSSN